jgi:adenylate cyclase
MRQEIYFISNLGKLKTKVNQLNGKKITPAEQDTLRQQYARVQKRIEDYLGEANTYANSSALTVLQMLASLHEHLEQPELSLQYLKKANDLKDSFYNATRLAELSEMEANITLEAEKQKIQFEEASKRLELQKEIALEALRFEFEKKQALAASEEERNRLLFE